MKLYKLPLLVVLATLAFAPAASAHPGLSWDNTLSFEWMPHPNSFSVENNSNESETFTIYLLNPAHNCEGPIKGEAESEYTPTELRPRQTEFFEISPTASYIICITNGGYYEEISTAKLEQEEAKELQEEAEENAARAAAHAQPVTTLRVHTAVDCANESCTHPGRNLRNPGDTLLSIKTSPFAHVTITLKRHGRYVAHEEASSDGSTFLYVNWTCKLPGGTYSYVITAQSDVGPALVRKGSFKPISAARCHALERAEQEARERSQHQYEAQVRRERETEEARINLFKENCRKENGTPRLFFQEGGSYWRCVASGGGFLPVPS